MTVSAEPEESVVDYRIVIKIPGDLPSSKMDFYSTIEEAKRKNTNRNNDIEAIRDNLKDMRGPFIEMCNSVLDSLETESKSITNINGLLGDYEFYVAKDAALLLIEEDKKEWELRKDIFLRMDLSLGSYGITGKLNGLKQSASQWLEHPLIKNCKGNVQVCIGKRSPYKDFVVSIKTWLLTQQMFGGPNDKKGLRIPN